MTKCVAVLNVLLLLLIISLSTWLVSLYFSDPTINMKVKVQSDCMKALFYLSGVTSNSIFPFSRILHSLLVPQTTTDEVTTFSLTVPSLQPNRSRETVPLRLYAPKTPKIKFQKIPVLVWMHGGGFVFGSVKDKTNDKIARELADHFGFYVIAVEYSLAPENKFPDALEDCYSVLYFLNENKADWILGQGRFENFKPMALNNVFIGGIGAGGNLAVHSKILWQDRIGPSGSERLQETTYFPHHHFHQGSWLNLIGEILVTPDLMVSDDHYRNATYVLTADTNEILRELYLQKTVARVPGEPALSHEESLELQKRNPYVSVLSRPGSCNLRLHVFSMMPMNLFHLQGIALKDAVTSSGLRAEAASLYDVPYGSLITSQKSFRFFLDSAQQFTEKVLTEYYY